MRGGQGLGSDRTLRVHPCTRHVRLAGLANLLLGVFLLRWPATMPGSLEDTPLERNFLIVGGLVAVCAAARVLFPQRYVALSVANLILGFWILLSPVVFSSERTWQLTAESVAAGVALMAFAWWSVSESLVARDSLR